MLHIITKINSENVSAYPKSVMKLKYSFDTEFSDELSKLVMKEIDNAEILMDKVIKTPFGVTTMDNLSSGCQSLLLAIKEKDNDVWIDFTCAGGNVVELALKICRDYNLDLYIYYNNYTCFGGKYDFEIDGKVYRDDYFTFAMNHIVGVNSEEGDGIY